MSKRYDRAYFDRWYRHPRRRVDSPAALARTVHFVVGMAEHVLGRPLRSVLDVGCGEGRWYPVLRRLRPRLRYLGVDPSPYAVGRFSRQRPLVHGSVGTLDTLPLDGPYDLVVCCDVLHYVSLPDLRRGLPALAAQVAGLAYLSLYTSADAIEGDLGGLRRRTPATYRRLLGAAGLVPCGMHCYLPRAAAGDLAALERPGR